MESELVAAIVGAGLGALLTWLLPPIWKSPEQKRLEKVQKATLTQAVQSPIFQNLSGEQRISVVNYIAATTARNSRYIATGEGAPTVPDVQRWLQAQAEEPRPVTKFMGTALISHASDSRVEVFYPAPFKRPPNLQIVPEGGTVKYSLQQRADGFMAKAEHYYASSDQGVTLKWSAEGELAVSQDLLSSR